MRTSNKMVGDEKFELILNDDSNISKATIKEESKFQRLTRIFREMEEICDEMEWMYIFALGDIELPMDENDALLTKARIFNKISGSECEFENLPVDIQEMIHEIVIDMDNRFISPEALIESDEMLKRIYQAIEEDKNSSFSLIA